MLGKDIRSGAGIAALALSVWVQAGSAMAAPPATLTVAFTSSSSSAVPFSLGGLLVIGAGLAIAALAALRFSGARRGIAFALAGLMVIGGTLTPRSAQATPPTGALSLTNPSPSTLSPISSGEVITVTNNVGASVTLTSVTSSDPSNAPIANSSTCVASLVLANGANCTVNIAT